MEDGICFDWEPTHLARRIHVQFSAVGMSLKYLWTMPFLLKDVTTYMA